MKFEINNRKWEIMEVDGNWLLCEYQKEYEDAIFCFGLTKYNTQIIYLNRDMKDDVKKQTLYHELMHCYIWSFVTKGIEISEEVMCDISANSHDLIHKIVDDYFKKIRIKDIN